MPYYASQQSKIHHTTMLCHSNKLSCPQRQALHVGIPGRALRLCRWAPDSQEQSDVPSDSSTTSSRDPETSRKLINQLLQIQSLSSLQSISEDDHQQGAPPQAVQPSETHLQQGQMPSALAEQLSSSAAQQVAAAPPSPAVQESVSLFDDPAAVDFDPLVLDMLGFTSVAQYLEHKVGCTAAEAKVGVAAVATWALVAVAMVVPLGGVAAYTDSIAIFTEGGLEMGNLVFLWVAVLAYYSIKGCVIGLVTSVRAWRLHEEQGQRLEELAATVQAQDQRRAFWKLQEKLQAADQKANRTYAEFALSSLLLGVLLLMSGGPDHLELQLGTLDEESYLKLLVVLWLFWETYFASVGSVVKVSNWVGAVLQKWQYSRKWGGRAGGGSSRE